MSRGARRHLAAGARRRLRQARGLGEGVGPLRAPPRRCRPTLHSGRRALPAHACGQAHRPDERVLLGGEGLPLPQRVVLAKAPIPSTGSCSRFVVVVVFMIYGLPSLSRRRPPVAGRRPPAAGQLVARVRDSGSGAENKIVISQPWRVRSRSRLAGWPDGAAVAQSVPAPYLEPLPVDTFGGRPPEENRLLYGGLL